MTRASTAIAEAAFVAEPEDTFLPEAVAAEVAPITVQPTTKNAKVKGTWTLYFGDQRWDFVDGHRYDLPLALFEYLVKHGNIYDTL